MVRTGQSSCLVLGEDEITVSGPNTRRGRAMIWALARRSSRAAKGN